VQAGGVPEETGPSCGQPNSRCGRVWNVPSSWLSVPWLASVNKASSVVSAIEAEQRLAPGTQ
jgi:hypothetical protein